MDCRRSADRLRSAFAADIFSDADDDHSSGRREAFHPFADASYGRTQGATEGRWCTGVDHWSKPDPLLVDSRMASAFPASGGVSRAAHYGAGEGARRLLRLDPIGKGGG